MSNFGILFVTDSNFIPLAINAIQTFCNNHNNFQIYLGLINVGVLDEEKIIRNLDLKDCHLNFLRSNTIRGVTTKDWAATRRAVFINEIFKDSQGKNLEGVIYFDVDYSFYQNVADQIADNNFDFILRSCVQISAEKAQKVHLDNCLKKSGNGKLETSVWANSPGERLDINSGLIWVKNTPKNIDLMEEWEAMMAKGNYVWFTDQNCLRKLLEDNLKLGTIKWRPVNRKLYKSFFHDKGPGKYKKIEALRKKYK